MIASTESGDGSASASETGVSVVSAVPWERADSSSTAPPTSRNGSLGMPGIRHSPIAPRPAIRSGCWCRVSCATRSEPMSASLAARVTMMPVATESSRAGICETRPSPMVSRL